MDVWIYISSKNSDKIQAHYVPRKVWWTNVPYPMPCRKRRRASDSLPGASSKIIPPHSNWKTESGAFTQPPNGPLVDKEYSQFNSKALKLSHLHSLQNTRQKTVLTTVCLMLKLHLFIAALTSSSASWNRQDLTDWLISTAFMNNMMTGGWPFYTKAYDP